MDGVNYSSIPGSRMAKGFCSETWGEVVDQFLVGEYFSEIFGAQTSARMFQAIDSSYVELFLLSHYPDAPNGCGLRATEFCQGQLI